ncbi:MAG TPA: glycoside hydrolase [Terriglobales bacterium]|nr:glycoside hydrolase [Terriglobales bacterium]
MERHLLQVLFLLLAGSIYPFHGRAQQGSSKTDVIKIDSTKNLGQWEGWGSSLAWWARAIGGTGNADYYADLIYTTKSRDGYPGLGLNIVRYNVGGGGINQTQENKGPTLQWQMDIHGYWPDPNSGDPTTWNWSVDENQRSMMQRARARGANVFEMFSDSPMWWMNANRSTSGSDTGGDCLAPENYDRFAFYLASVARHSADHWGINFDSVEPLNEPSADWWKYPGRQEGCHFDIVTQQKIVDSLRRALDQVHLNDVVVAAADENNMDAGLNTWNAYNAPTRELVGLVNVHGYSKGTEPYRGPNRAELRRVVGTKRLWQSEYGDGDASGYTMAQTIIRDLKELRPSAWVYWQPVEPDVPDYGWGLINANYIDTRDKPSSEKTPLVRINRKFYVYGQFTRYLRAGYQRIEIDDANSVAAYDRSSRKLVVVEVSGNTPAEKTLDISPFSALGDTVQVIATTTAPGSDVPDWKQHLESVRLGNKENKRLVSTHLHPRSIYTLVIPAILR